MKGEKRNALWGVFAPQPRLPEKKQGSEASGGRDPAVPTGAHWRHSATRSFDPICPRMTHGFTPWCPTWAGRERAERSEARQRELRLRNLTDLKEKKEKRYIIYSCKIFSEFPLCSWQQEKNHNFKCGWVLKHRKDVSEQPEVWDSLRLQNGFFFCWSEITAVTESWLYNFFFFCCAYTSLTM